MATTDSSAHPSGPDAPDDPGWKAAWPFLVAVVIVVLALGAIGLFHVLRPASERLTDTAKITHAINDYYTAKNSITYDKFRDASCATDQKSATFPSAATFRDAAQRSRDEHGNIVVTDITETAVNGGTATANMHWNYNKNPSNQILPLALVKQGDDWKVCGPKGP